MRDLLTKLDVSIIAYSLVNAESCRGATVRRGDRQTIIDSHGNIWELDSEGTIIVNSHLEEHYDWNGSEEEGRGGTFTFFSLSERKEKESFYFPFF